MQIAIRLDDITPDMDWDKFYNFKKLLDQYQIKPLIGVVPDNRDSNLHKEEKKQEFWQYIRQLQEEGWVIALHGYQHLYTTNKSGLFPLNNFSEFAGVPLEKQREMLQKGTELLKSYEIQTNVFMAPGHSFDKNTLRVLKELGYSYLTDGFGKKPYLRKGITFLPISVSRKRSLEKQDGATTFVYHLNEMSEESYKNQVKFFEEYKDNLISYSKFMELSAKKRNFFGNIMEYSLAKMKFYLMKFRG